MNTSASVVTDMETPPPALPALIHNRRELQELAASGQVVARTPLITLVQIPFWLVMGQSVKNIQLYLDCGANPHAVLRTLMGGAPAISTGLVSNCMAQLQAVADSKCLPWLKY